MPRRCIFCGSPDVTNEHALAQWISKKIVPQGTTLQYSETGIATASPKHYRHRSTGLLDVQVKQACGTCNSGWMNDLEGAARPWLTLMMQGVPVSLNAKTQRIIAAWAAKTAFMLLCAQSPPVLVHKDYRDCLFTKKAAPPGVGIWLGAYAGRVKAQYNLRHVQVDRLLPLAPKPLRRSTESELVSFSIGYLVVQIWTWTNPRQQVAPILFPSKFREFVLQIWPRNHVEQTWPPLAVFDDEGVWRFFGMTDDAIRRAFTIMPP